MLTEKIITHFLILGKGLDELSVHCLTGKFSALPVLYEGEYLVKIGGYSLYKMVTEKIKNSKYGYSLEYAFRDGDRNVQATIIQDKQKGTAVSKEGVVSFWNDDKEFIKNADIILCDEMVFAKIRKEGD